MRRSREVTKVSPKDEPAVIEGVKKIPEQEALVLPQSCRFSPMCLTATEAMTMDEWRTLLSTVTSVEGASPWWLGDTLLIGEEKGFIKSGKYALAEALTGKKRGTLKVYASVARAFPALNRINRLSFAHHQLIQGQPVADRKGWLERAVRETMTVEELRAALPRKERRRAAKTHQEELSSLKEKLLRVVEPYKDWDELSDIRKAIESLETEA